jgi:transcriptional regulator with XRE-family HTH domain
MPGDLSLVFGRRLREVRKEHGMSQEDLARRTDLHTTAIGRFERGLREPRLKSILRLAEGLAVAPGALLDGFTRGADQPPRSPIPRVKTSRPQ